jgi:hypothetical protein
VGGGGVRCGGEGEGADAPIRRDPRALCQPGPHSAPPPARPRPGSCSETDLPTRGVPPAFARTQPPGTRFHRSPWRTGRPSGGHRAVALGGPRRLPAVPHSGTPPSRRRPPSRSRRAYPSAGHQPPSGGWEQGGGRERGRAAWSAGCCLHRPGPARGLHVLGGWGWVKGVREQGDIQRYNERGRGLALPPLAGPTAPSGRRPSKWLSRGLAPARIGRSSLRQIGRCPAPAMLSQQKSQRKCRCLCEVLETRDLSGFEDVC